MIPNAKIAKLVIAPPEKSWRNPSTPLWLAWSRRVRSALVWMPGTGRCAPSRYKVIIKIVKSTLLRRSGTLKMLRRLESTGGLLPVREVVALRRGPPVAPGQGQDLNRTACRGDGFPRGRRKCVGLHRHRSRQLAP